MAMTDSNADSRMGIVGGGLMGCGIAAICAAFGIEVIVCDSDADTHAGIRARCRATFSELESGGLIDAGQADEANSRLSVVSRIEEMAESHFVIEAIVESLAAKQSVYALLEKVVSNSTPIASTTSGIPPDRLGERFDRPERFLVAHFWNPPHIIPLVEVVPHSKTAGETVERTISLLRHIGCEPVVLEKVVPGFIGNRIQFAVLREALHLLRLGVADADTIDRVVRHSVGRRYRGIGPLEGADLGGLETFLAIGQQLMPELAKGEEVLDELEVRIGRGETGRTSGQGIYLWDTDRERRLIEIRSKMLLDNDALARRADAVRDRRCTPNR